ncbi:MAG: Holliday junction resolvase RuvX [Patescibacteria group bacterium]|nr:Holliday junction resolvase RuvX [Patescibacteria group bacterium]
MTKILSIDYGNKKIGLAISDINKKLASRFLTLKNKSLKSSIEEIKDIITDKEIGEIVVGLPVGLKAESSQTRKTNRFIDYLAEEISIPIKKINEVFTSKMAEENLRRAGIKSEEIKKVIDQEAARIFLQDYLDSKSK